MNKKTTLSGLDIAAPGGLDKLFAFHRSLFGDAVMEAGAGEGSQEPKPGEQQKQDNQPKPDGDESKLDDAGLRALQRVRDEKAAEKLRADELQKKLDKIEEDKLSDIQKAQKQAADKEKEAEELRTENLRLKAIASHNVPADYQDLVHGTDAESFAASAKKIAELAAKAEGKGNRPDPIRESGSGSGDSGGNTSSGLTAGRERFAASKKKK